MLMRPDASEFLVHLIRHNDQMHAYDILKKILNDGYIKGSSKYIKSKEEVICFTESTLPHLGEHIRLYNRFLRKYETNRPLYNFYGLAFDKDLMYEHWGARPVIYQPESEFSKLPVELKYLHQTHQPINNINFSWEREWRLKVKTFEIEDEFISPILLVEDLEDVIDIQQEFYDRQANEYTCISHYHTPFSVDIQIFPYPIIPLIIFK